MAAAIERMREYETHNAQFCKRVSDYLTIMIKFQVRLHPHFSLLSPRAARTYADVSIFFSALTGRKRSKRQRAL
jgi:hypothetical protein